MFRILVVDDDPAILKLVVRYVEAAGFEPVAAADGPTALARAREDSVDLAVVDIMLPGVSGLEICRRLREDFGIPVIMLTARGGIEDKSQAYRLGADDYLVKPFDPNELVLRIRAVLKRVLDPNLRPFGIDPEARGSDRGPDDPHAPEGIPAPVAAGGQPQPGHDPGADCRGPLGRSTWRRRAAWSAP